jgi:hypothetical protein
VVPITAPLAVIRCGAGALAIYVNGGFEAFRFMAGKIAVFNVL